MVVLNLYNGTPWTLVTGKEINKPQDFIGKKVAISGLRTSSYYFAMAGFKKIGMDDKDVGLFLRVALLPALLPAPATRWRGLC